MKANRKFRDGEEAVSAVIGVILMVAITVAIAATVYVYVSGMIGGTQTQTPNVTFTPDHANDKIVVASADAGVSWADVEIKTDDASTKINGTRVGTNWTTADATLISWAGTGTTGPYISAGDEFVASDVTGGSATIEITLRYTPTNALMGSWTVTV